jgi:hypothetical protein
MCFERLAWNAILFEPMRSKAKISGQRAAMMLGETLAHCRSDADNIEHSTERALVLLDARQDQHGAALVRRQLPQVFA